jgi:hypothetical protein
MDFIILNMEILSWDMYYHLFNFLDFKPMQYQGGFRGHFEKKGYGYRKHYGYTPTHTQVVYAKKPKTNTQVNALSSHIHSLGK